MFDATRPVRFERNDHRLLTTIGEQFKIMTRILFTIFLMPILLVAQVEINLPVEVEVSSKTEESLYDLVFLKQGTSEELEELKKVPVGFLNKKGIRQHKPYSSVIFLTSNLSSMKYSFPLLICIKTKVIITNADTK